MKAVGFFQVNLPPGCLRLVKLKRSVWAELGTEDDNGVWLISVTHLPSSSRKQGVFLSDSNGPNLLKMTSFVSHSQLFVLVFVHIFTNETQKAFSVGLIPGKKKRIA